MKISISGTRSEEIAGRFFLSTQTLLHVLTAVDTSTKPKLRPSAVMNIRASVYLLEPLCILPSYRGRLDVQYLSLHARAKALCSTNLDGSFTHNTLSSLTDVFPKARSSPIRWKRRKALCSTTPSLSSHFLETPFCLTLEFIAREPRLQ